MADFLRKLFGEREIKVQQVNIAKDLHDVGKLIDIIKGEKPDVIKFTRQKGDNFGAIEKLEIVSPDGKTVRYGVVYPSLVWGGWELIKKKKWGIK